MKKILVLLTVFIMALSFVSHGALFSDTNGHWANEYIEFLAMEGVISGMGDGSFAPDEFVTREQFLKMLMIVTSGSANERIAYENPVNGEYVYEKSPFSDVATDRWSYFYIKEAFGNIVLAEEYGEKFEPVKDITREEAAVWIARALNLGEGACNFTDNHLIGKPNLVGAAYEKGLISGFPDGSFGPGQGLTRAQAAVMLKRAEDYNEKAIEAELTSEIVTFERDLFVDSVPETVKIVAEGERYMVKVNDVSALGGLCTVADSKFFLIDVDKNDSYMELAVVESYYASGALAIYRFTGKEVYLMGYIESVGGIALRTDSTPLGDEWGAIAVNSDGTLTGNIGEQFVHTMLVRKQYKLNDKNRLVPATNEYYTIGNHSNFVVNQLLVSDYEDAAHPGIVLKEGYAGKIVKTDLKNWLYIETGSGDAGWIYVQNDGLLGGEPIYYYLEGLLYAG
ncbi:MAG: S-layer homology domain-containing protein [Clostridia bacterium]|nr:S-layer homology domain-containing protein [Clostridia bacterium]